MLFFLFFCSSSTDFLNDRPVEHRPTAVPIKPATSVTPEGLKKAFDTLNPQVKLDALGLGLGLGDAEGGWYGVEILKLAQNTQAN